VTARAGVEPTTFG